MAFASSSTSTTVVVTGATGKVGSRLVKQMLQDDDTNATNDIRVVALVRNATKAGSLFPPSSSLDIVQVNFEDENSLQSAFGKYDGFGLFLACGNVPNQQDLELNICRAAAAASCWHCVKLSTAQPVIEQKESYGSAHQVVEKELSTLFVDNQYSILRPHMFMQMLDPNLGGPLLGIDLRETNVCTHAFANAPMALIDCEDVAACAKAILLDSRYDNDKNSKRIRRHAGKVYELTGPKAFTLQQEVAKVISTLRPSDKQVSIQPCSIDDVVSMLPPIVADQMKAFLKTLMEYDTVTNDFESLTGQRPKSIEEFIIQNPRSFLPRQSRTGNEIN
eukprot:CAMPEP_0178897078 /NCGR_PEP_ID=MMETSP0786-20121207/1541_1 /TAXON_ID=186022 /ORGANISM="Thalassionema frauenfeldii, Strain CCMP 1798" /LENGTH=332 /DNA_ID=CAMNT_0020567577 /DNA_START=132 /DNA_END=1130 /DNA_ORIENTATION=-